VAALQGSGQEVEQDAVVVCASVLYDVWPDRPVIVAGDTRGDKNGQDHQVISPLEHRVGDLGIQFFGRFFRLCKR
jgi:hypothetical protein